MLGHLIDFLLDDGLLSLHCQLDDFRLLHFNCVDDVLSMRVHTLLRLSLNLSDKTLDDLPSEKNQEYQLSAPPNAVESCPEETP